MLIAFFDRRKFIKNWFAFCFNADAIMQSTNIYVDSPLRNTFAKQKIVNEHSVW